MKTTIATIKQTVKNGRLKKTPVNKQSLDSEEVAKAIKELRDKRTPVFEVDNGETVDTYTLRLKNYIKESKIKPKKKKQKSL